ncbi:unnamed protein product, partial [Effrenium voratum]
RLAGVLAKQHSEVSKLQRQLIALQQLNQLGAHVGESHQTDETVHEFMVKIAPKCGRKAPQWQPLSPLRSSRSSAPSASARCASQEDVRAAEVEHADLEEIAEDANVEHNGESSPDPACSEGAPDAK